MDSARVQELKDEARAKPFRQDLALPSFLSSHDSERQSHANRALPRRRQGKVGGARPSQISLPLSL